jgi:hypothetical protein
MDLGGVPERVFKTHSCSDSLPTASQMDRVFGSDRYIAPHKMSEIRSCCRYAGIYPAAPQFEFLSARVNTSAIVSSLRMEARYYKHQNKHNRRSCQRKGCDFRHEIRKHIVSCHDLLLSIHSIIIERIVYGALGKNLRTIFFLGSFASIMRTGLG